jgi:hypothetical protein
MTFNEQMNLNIYPVFFTKYDKIGKEIETRVQKANNVNYLHHFLNTLKSLHQPKDRLKQKN